MANLDGMELGSNQLSGEIPPELANLTNLRYLEPEDNQLSGCLPSSLQDQLEVTRLGEVNFCP